MNLIYLRLEGTLSNLVIFYDSEFLKIRRVAIDAKVESRIGRLRSLYCLTSSKCDIDP